jgi:hypothetical protein
MASGRNGPVIKPSASVGSDVEQWTQGGTMTPEQLKTEIRNLWKRSTDCRDVAIAMVESNEVLTYYDPILAPFVSTDYDRARAAFLSQLKFIRSQLQQIRRSRPSPDAVRADNFLKEVQACCGTCRSSNKNNRHGPVSCKASELLAAHKLMRSTQQSSSCQR